MLETYDAYPIFGANLWNTARTATFVLVACLLPASLQAQPFIGNINRWIVQDALNNPAAGSILFTGSSSIRRWEQLAFDFADYSVIQRGFGGSQFEHLNSYVNDIVLPYNPSAILVWEGTNDINGGETPAEVLTDYENFVSLVHTAQPNVEIFFLGIVPTPGRFACCEADNTTLNNSISTLAASNPKLHYIDLPTAFNALNPPSSSEFLSFFDDNIHLNRDGYDVWTSIVRPQLEAVVEPNKVFTLNPVTPQPGSKVFFDFGPNNSQDGDHTTSPDTNGNHWNNWHASNGGTVVIAGEHIGNLIDSTGRSTGINLTITAGFNTNGKVNGGLLTPNAGLLDDLAVATATQDYFFSTGDKKNFNRSDEVGGGFVINGLDPNLQYDFTFFGSRNSTQERITEYLLTGANSKVATLQTSGINIGDDVIYDGNDDEIITLANIRPDTFGQIFFDMTLISGDFAYLNAMKIAVVVPEPSTASAVAIFAGMVLAGTFRRRQFL